MRSCKPADQAQACTPACSTKLYRFGAWDATQQEARAAIGRVDNLTLASPVP